ncbi:SDR family NAD(P)-dependent oxidoreductase [Lichenicoccus sp.]|uniref:SDR family NAD(P)-dependent oxidoreductase n=1 Tax=Lichenicoccus sp. TaxID=2781899 RepID=UPI003D0E0014
MPDPIESFATGLFAGRHVLVSGGSSGIGLAVARGFARAGARVTATGTSERKLAALRAEDADASVRFERLDVRDSQAISTFVDRLPGLDVLVNAAGVALPVREFDEDAYLTVIDVNLNSVMRLSMAARGKLRAAQGSIINFASMLSTLADPAVPAYGASKAGVLGLTRHLAHAFGPEGIRVNAVAPGYHRTDMTAGLWQDPVSEARIAARSALKRWGSAEDLVGACLFLASPAAGFVTGANLVVDGGYLSGTT